MKQGVRRGSGVVTGFALLALLSGCGSGDGTDAAGGKCERAAGPRRLALAPAADAYVQEEQGMAVSGGERKLVADNLSRRSAFLRFEVPELPGPVLGARLLLYAMDGSTDGPKLYAATSDWSEDASTWERSPTLVGEPLGDAGNVPNGTWVVYDLTSTVKSVGTYGFGLVTESRNGVDFASKEHVHSTWAPKLELTVDAPASEECDPFR
jgi:hypothetical protein